MKKLRDKGFSYSEIAERIEKEYEEKITRQRVHQVVSNYTPPEKQSLATKRLHKIIKERDNFCCQWGEKCDQKRERKEDLVIHYIDFDNNNEDPSNLITLCKKCHASFHGRFHIDEEIEKNLHEATKKEKS